MTRASIAAHFDHDPSSTSGKPRMRRLAHVFATTLAATLVLATGAGHARAQGSRFT